MKLLFLDIDGVLNSLVWYKIRNLDENRFKDKDRSLFTRTCEEIDPRPLNLLKEFVEENNIKIVVSSSWRLLMPYTELKEVFKKVGWEEAPLIADTSNFGSRGEEIKAFIRDFKLPIDSYAIIDDDSDMTIEQKKSHFVKTEWCFGLQEEHIKKLKTILL